MYETKVLEFDLILDEVAKYAEILKTKERIKQLTPKEDIEWVNHQLDEVEEARMDIVSYGTVPLGGITDISPSLAKAKIGSTLSTSELFSILEFLEGLKSIKAYFKTLINEQIVVNYLSNYSLLGDYKSLHDEISVCINEKGEMMDSASSELLSLRKAKVQAENRLTQKMNDILAHQGKMLNEAMIVRRNDRLCVPVKAEYKNSFKGIIQDESGSGTTFFIEPLVCVEITNQICSITNQEKIEIEKILRRLTQSVGNFQSDLGIDFEKVLILDSIFAKARYAKEKDCYRPLLNEEGITELVSARHPLIDAKKVVPLDIEIGSHYDTIIITGPNTGGKTVALKTVGLCTIMAMSGLLIPSLPNSKIALYSNVFVDIGDAQSISQSLSTFSSHMTKIKNIIDHLTVNSLVLLDELGSGTDPKEGTSLAMSILNYLRKRSSRTIITTHYSELKAFAYNEENIINASVEFDSLTLEPTYRLLLGVPGKSNAIEICERLGLPLEITKNAKENETLIKDDSAMFLEKLEHEANYYEKKRIEYEELVKEMKIKEEEFIKKEESQNNEKRRILEEATKKANSIYSDANEKINDLIKEVEALKKKEDLKEHEIADIKHKTKELASSRILEPHIDQPIGVNDKVFVIPYNCQGVVYKVNKDIYEVKMGNLASKFKKTDLNFLAHQKENKEKPKGIMVSGKKEGKLELDLRGYRYEEAEIAIDKFIDRAILANYKMVYIIHGFGTGAIRKAVWEYLKNCKYVENYRYGGEGEGLNGVTVCYLK